MSQVNAFGQSWELKIDEKNKKLILTIDMPDEAYDSSTGKSDMLFSSGQFAQSNLRTEDGRTIWLSAQIGANKPRKPNQ